MVADIEQETDGGNGGGGGSMESAEDVAKKKLTEWENLQKEVRKLLQKDELIGLDKVAADKEKIRQEYGDLVERIEAFTDSKGQAAKDLADQVRKYMDNAIGEIDRAARAEQMKKVTQQYEKLCEQFQTLKEKLGQNLTDSYSAELMQVEQKWKATIAEIDKSIAYYESKQGEEYDPVKGTGLNEDELKLLETSIPRNENIANAFYLAGFIEAWGRGIEKIVTGMKKAEMDAPEFRADSLGVFVTFHRKKEIVAMWNGNDGNAGVTEKVVEKVTEIQQAIMREIREKLFVTASKLSEMLGISLRKTQENMRKLRETGLIRRGGPDKGGHWEVIDQQP